MVVKAKPRKPTKKEKLVLEAAAWLKDQGFSDEEIEGMKEQYTPERMAKIAEGYMRQADYDRTMDEGNAELTTARTDLAAANARLNTEMAEWGTVQRDGKEASIKLQTDLEAAHVRVTELTSRVTKLATEAGVDPKTILGDVEVVPPKDTKPDMTGYVKADDLDAAINKRLGGLATGILDVPAELFQLGQEHQTLFGEPLDTRPIVAEIKKRAATANNQESLDPRAVWEELHDVVDKREEVATATHDAEIAAAVERGRTEMASEQAIPGSTTAPGRHAAIFGGKDRKSALERPQPMTTVNAAAAALTSGKYRQGSGAGKGTGDGAGAT
jgi:hypothetical protein